MTLAAERGGFYATLQHAPALINVFAGPVHRYEFVNAAFTALLGERDFLGKTVRAAQPELEGQGIYELLDHVYQTGEPFVGSAVPVRVDTPEGPHERHYTFTYQARRNAAGDIDGVVSFAFDVTEQVAATQRAEALAAQLTAERDWLRQVLDALPEAVQIVDVAGHYVLANRATMCLPIGPRRCCSALMSPAWRYRQASGNRMPSLARGEETGHLRRETTYRCGVRWVERDCM